MLDVGRGVLGNRLVGGLGKPLLSRVEQPFSPLHRPLLQLPPQLLRGCMVAAVSAYVADVPMLIDIPDRIGRGLGQDSLAILGELGSSPLPSGIEPLRDHLALPLDHPSPGGQRLLLHSVEHARHRSPLALRATPLGICCTDVQSEQVRQFVDALDA